MIWNMSEKIKRLGQAGSETDNECNYKKTRLIIPKNLTDSYAELRDHR